MRLYQVISALGTHVYPLFLSTDLVVHPLFLFTDPIVHASGRSADPFVHASKDSGLGQMWVELQHFLQQDISIDPFIYCEVEQELRCEESDEHPRQVEEKATGVGVTSAGYVEVQSAPYAYDHGAGAKRDDCKSAPPLWFGLPVI